MVGPRRRWLALVAGLVLAACGGPSLAPVGDGPHGAAAGGAVDGCRRALPDDDPHPIRDGAGTGQDPALTGAWVEEIAAEVQTAHTDVLGGLWLDHDAGELVIMVPGTEGRDEFERLRAEAPEPERVVCMEATHTEDELRDLQHQVSERLTPNGRPLVSGTDVVTNRLRVEYEGDLAEAEEALGELAGHPGLELQVPACAEVVPLPDGAQPLPGGGSTCQSMEALFTGTLVGDPAAGCAWFEDQQGQPTTVLWPRGWSLTEDGTVLDHRGEPRARLGDAIASGGGNVPLQEGQRACGTGGEDGAWAVGTLEAAPAS
ncbi:MAG: hypothetical protein KY457_06665 [Actinobacteria bacterium]|nr:hypothetical protein [Actinomycetota bacterium]